MSGEALVTQFAVSEEKNKWLMDKMDSLGLFEKDIIEKFVRSSGKGGQKVNKTSTCVYLKHIPTGLEVKCMKDRSQSLNRFLARRELVEKFEEFSGIRSGNKNEQEKKRRQKTKKAKRAKTKYGPCCKVIQTE